MNRAIVEALMDRIKADSYLTVGKAIAEYGEYAGEVLGFLAEKGVVRAHYSTYPADVDPNPVVIVHGGRACMFSRK